MKEIHGLRVYNAGISVKIGEKGEVVGAGSSLRELEPEPIRYVKVVSLEQAYQRLLSNDLVIRPLSQDWGDIYITNISLGYWMEIKIYPQEYVLPVYVFTGNEVRRDKSEQVIQYVPAVDSSEI